jgi:hypothetical protein
MLKIVILIFIIVNSYCNNVTLVKRNKMSNNEVENKNWTVSQIKDNRYTVFFRYLTNL